MVLAEEQGFPNLSASATVLWGWTDVIQGRGATGIAEIRQGLSAWKSTGHRGMMPYIFLLWADACLVVEKLDEGLRAVQEGLNAVSETGDCMWQPELHRLRGELLLKADPEDLRAEDCFGQALDVARRQGAKSLELRSALSMSRLWQRRGKRDEALSLLVKAHEALTEGYDTADLKQTHAFLAELG